MVEKKEFSAASVMEKKFITMEELLLLVCVLASLMLIQHTLVKSIHKN